MKKLCILLILTRAALAVKQIQDTDYTGIVGATFTKRKQAGIAEPRRSLARTTIKERPVAAMRANAGG